MILNEKMLRLAAREAYYSKMDSVYLAESQTFSAMIQYDLFISHSFADKDLIVGISSYFYKCGYKIYIDWIDDKDLDRDNVTIKTANLLKERIWQSHGLAYVATRNITRSKWCSWELGVADGMHGKACILPIMDTNFCGMEFLGLYPHLEYISTVGGGDFFVYFLNNRAVSLRDWLG